MYADPSGNSIILTSIIIGAVVGAVIGAISGAAISNVKKGYVDWKWALTGAGIGAVAGGLAGWGVGSAITLASSSAAIAPIGTTVYETWKAAEQSLRDLIGSVTTYAERVFETPYGNRVADAYNKTKGVIAEAKYGYASLTEFVQNQINKDAFLLESGKVKSVEWHFYTSSITGKIGPSGPLLEELSKQGFKVIFH